MATKPIQEAMREEIIELVRKNLSAAHIANNVGCTRALVYRVIQEAGLSNARLDGKAATIKLGLRLGFSLRAMATYLGISRTYCQKLSKREIPRTAKPDLTISVDKPVEDTSGHYIPCHRYQAFPIGDEIYLQSYEGSYFVALRKLLRRISL